MDQDTRDLYKKMVEEIFQSAKKHHKEQDKLHTENIGKEIDGMDVNELCIEKALMELEEIRIAFVEFQRAIKPLALYPFLNDQLDSLAEYAQLLADIVDGEFDKDKYDKEKYDKAKQLRAKILSDIYRKYIKEEE